MTEKEQKIYDGTKITRPFCVSCEEEFDEVFRCQRCLETLCETCGMFRFSYFLCDDDKTEDDDDKFECGFEISEHEPDDYFCENCAD